MSAKYNFCYFIFYKQSQRLLFLIEEDRVGFKKQLIQVLQINDNFGHDVGDEALKNTMEMLKKSVREGDFIARAGGDEFIVILDIHDYEMLEQAVARIQAEFERFNEESNEPYHISFSIGYDVYDVKSNMKPDDFLKHIDLLMYRDKQQKPKKKNP